MKTILMIGNLGATELFIFVVVIGVVIILPIITYVNNQKLKTQNKFLQKDSLNLDLHKLGEMKDKGLLTEMEYKQKKEEILRRM
jgi:uncharacterized membrane protein